MLSFGGEPFFREHGSVDGLYHWLVRELRTHSQRYELVVYRDSQRVVLNGSFRLGSYRGYEALPHFLAPAASLALPCPPPEQGTDPQTLFGLIGSTDRNHVMTSRRY